jgi:hypothetical protein
MSAQELRSTASSFESWSPATRVMPLAPVLMMARLALLHGVGQARAEEAVENDAEPSVRPAPDVVVPKVVYVAPAVYPRAAWARAWLASTESGS